jgi:hypothetical protein
MPINMTAVLSSLGARRPIFHSEADFQHELAWELRTCPPGAKQLRLEYPVPRVRPRMELDIWVVERHPLTGAQYRTAIELKYKTRRASAHFAGEQFSLTQQAATPLGRYDFWKDVYRLETVRHARSADEAWVVFLTNDSAYYGSNGGRGNGTAFSIANGRNVTAGTQMGWRSAVNPASLGKQRLTPITVSGSYALGWADYSNVADQVFRYIALPV